MSTRYSAPALTASAIALLTAAGADADKAKRSRRFLVEGDLMGHDTHGLALLGPYLGELENGGMGKSGEPKVLNSRPPPRCGTACACPAPGWCSRRWKQCAAMARTYGTGTISIRRSHHIAALAAYLKRATDQGLVMLLYCSDRNSASVAPHGGMDPVVHPQPDGFRLPTGRRAHPGRHFLFHHHQRHEQPPGQGRQALSRQVADR